MMDRNMSLTEAYQTKFGPNTVLQALGSASSGRKLHSLASIFTKNSITDGADASRAQLEQMIVAAGFPATQERIDTLNAAFEYRKC